MVNSAEMLGGKKGSLQKAVTKLSYFILRITVLIFVPG